LINTFSKTVTRNSSPFCGTVAKSFVPNLYATFGYSENSLGTFLTLLNAKSSLSKKECEIVNDCRYCQSAHTILGKMNGFTDEQILEIRTAEASFDAKLNALAVFVKEAPENRGHASAESVENFFAAGYTNESLVDVLMVIVDKIISNYLHAVTQIPAL
jgi:alkylhydroperoxidase family enzyme